MAVRMKRGLPMMTKILGWWKRTQGSPKRLNNWFSREIFSLVLPQANDAPALESHYGNWQLPPGCVGNIVKL